MHNFLAGFMGFFVGMTSMFHGGGTPAVIHHTTMMQQINISGTPASSSGMMHANGKEAWDDDKKLPAGARPFLGTVTNVNGSTLTVQMLGMMMPYMRVKSANVTVTTTPSVPRTITVDLTSTTTFIGGSQSDIVTNTKIAGIGTNNSDGTITAVKVQINPTMPPLPSGFPHRPMPTREQ